jgi:hypothetical protein
VSETFKIVLTSAVTILGGVVVFVCGQLIQRFCIEPVDQLARLIGEVGDALVFYANQYANPGIGTKEDMEEAYKVLRRQSGMLRVRAQLVRGYSLWHALGVLPARADVAKAAEGLMHLSNSVFRGDADLNVKVASDVRKRLGIIGARESQEGG